MGYPWSRVKRARISFSRRVTVSLPPLVSPADDLTVEEVRRCFAYCKKALES